jgi:hypothetical protein
MRYIITNHTQSKNTHTHDAALHNPISSAFINRNVQLFNVLHALFISDTLTTWAHQQTGNVDQASAPPTSQRNTPPQVDRFAFINVDPKKDKNGPKPAETKPDKTKKEQQTEREGDKGKQRVKRVKRSQLVSSLLSSFVLKRRIFSGLALVLRRFI